ncbi:MAG: hypothetical protein ACRDNB_03330 [Gaiellaceae bacterium]
MVLALVLLAVAGCGGDGTGTGIPTIPTVTIIGDACRDGVSPHTPAEVVAALGEQGITALADGDVCEDGQRMVNGLLGDGLAGEENAVYCFVAATPAAYRDRRLFSDQVRQDNVLCNTHSVRVHKRVAAALRQLPG